MIATDRPRCHLCASCVRARGLQHCGSHTRVAEDVGIEGICEDCGVHFAKLEAWRRLDVPPPASTIPVLDITDDDDEETTR